MKLLLQYKFYFKAGLAVIMVNLASVNDLINYATFVVWLQRVFTIAGLMWIRIKKYPVSDKAIKVIFKFCNYSVYVISVTVTNIFITVRFHYWHMLCFYCLFYFWLVYKLTQHGSLPRLVAVLL